MACECFDEYVYFSLACECVNEYVRVSLRYVSVVMNMSACGLNCVGEYVRLLIEVTDFAAELF